MSKPTFEQLLATQGLTRSQLISLCRQSKSGRLGDDGVRKIFRLHDKLRAKKWQHLMPEYNQVHAEGCDLAISDVNPFHNRKDS